MGWGQKHIQMQIEGPSTIFLPVLQLVLCLPQGLGWAEQPLIYRKDVSGRARDCQMSKTFEISPRLKSPTLESQDSYKELLK